MQLARIEQREACLRRIRAKLQRPVKVRNGSATGSKALKDRYHIGKSENVYRHIGTFLWNNAGDPAIKVSQIYLTAGVCAENARRIIYQS